MLWNFPRHERRKNIWQVHLVAVLEISIGELEILAHQADLDIVGSQNVAQLAESFFRAHVGAGIARAVVSREKQLEPFSRLPAFPLAENPPGLGALDVSADPGLQDEVHHAA